MYVVIRGPSSRCWWWWWWHDEAWQLQVGGQSSFPPVYGGLKTISVRFPATLKLHPSGGFSRWAGTGQQGFLWGIRSCAACESASEHLSRSLSLHLSFSPYLHLSIFIPRYLSIFLCWRSPWARSTAARCSRDRSAPAGTWSPWTCAGHPGERRGIAMGVTEVIVVVVVVAVVVSSSK